MPVNIDLIKNLPINSSLSQSISDLRGPKQGGSVRQKQPILGPKSRFPTFTPTVWELFGYSLGISWALQRPPLGTLVVYFMVSTALIKRFQSQNWAPRVASKKTKFFPKNTISDILTTCLGVVCEQFGHTLGTPEASIRRQSGVFCRLLSPYVLISANGWKIDKKINF